MTNDLITHSHVDLERLFKQQQPNRAVECPDRLLSFGDLKQQVDLVLRNLAQLGVQKGMRVGLHAESTLLHFALLIAAFIMDFVFVPLNAKSPIQVYRSQLELNLLFTTEPLSLPMDTTPLTTFHPQVLTTETTDTALSRYWPPIPLEQEATVIFTSGSSGPPKGVLHTVGNYIYSALGTNEFLNIDANDRWLVSLPLFHVSGLLILMRTLLSGSTSILPRSTSDLTEVIVSSAPSVISMVPTQLIRCLQFKAAITVLQNCKAILLGGAPSPGWLIKTALELELPIVPTYGSTETCAQVTGVPPNSGADAFYTAGTPLAYRKIKIDEQGVIHVGGATLFKYYIVQGNKIRGRAPHFFKTSDIGKLDKNHNLIITGRVDQVFISGGENINPHEIEHVLTKLATITSAMVVPVPHPDYGMVPFAFIESNEPFDPDQIKGYLRQHLPSFKIPKYFEWLNNVPTGNGIKPLRQELAKIAREKVKQTETP